MPALPTKVPDKLRSVVGRRRGADPTVQMPAAIPSGTSAGPTASAPSNDAVDLERRRNQLSARVAELQWDLGGLFYEMAVRNKIQIDVLVKRAALLQDADSELGEVERILRMEHTGVADMCSTCGAPHSSGAVYCWQCGNSLLKQVPSGAITAP